MSNKPSMIIFRNILLIILALILAVEVTLRIAWKNPWAHYNRYIFLREHIPNDNIAYVMADEEGNPRKVTLNINDDGFIQPSFIKNGEKAITLAFLGGSTTECLFVSEEKRFPYLVGKMFSDYTGASVKVLNAGSAGNNLHGSLNIYLNKIVKYKPDFVLIMHSVNDVGLLKAKNNYRDFMVKDANNPADILSKYSYAIAIARQIKKNRYLKHYRNTKAINDARGCLQPLGTKLQKTTVDKYFPEYSTRLRTLIYMVRQFGGVPVLMTEPIYTTENIPEGYENTFYSGISEANVFNDEIRRIAKEENCALIDLDKELPKEKVYFYDHIHYFDKGSQKVSEIISEHLKALWK